jgi:hypothetical protein
VIRTRELLVRCEVCGTQITKGQDSVRFGKHFCSEEHAYRYVSEMKQKDACC